MGDEVKIRLGALGKLYRYGGGTLKIIGSATGKTLVQAYNAEKHEFLNDLEVTGIYTDLELGGVTCKNWGRTRLVGWARYNQYKELKEVFESAGKSKRKP